MGRFEIVDSGGWFHNGTCSKVKREDQNFISVRFDTQKLSISSFNTWLLRS